MWGEEEAVDGGEVVLVEDGEDGFAEGGGDRAEGLGGGEEVDVPEVVGVGEEVEGGGMEGVGAEGVQAWERIVGLVRASGGVYGGR